MAFIYFRNKEYLIQRTGDEEQISAAAYQKLKSELNQPLFYTTVQKVEERFQLTVYDRQYQTTYSELLEEQDAHYQCAYEFYHGKKLAKPTSSEGAWGDILKKTLRVGVMLLGAYAFYSWNVPLFLAPS